MNVGKIIRKIRKEKFIKQEDFAKSLGITQSYLSQVETCKKNANMSLLTTISNQLGIPLGVLFWMSMVEEDIKEDKKASFRFLKPTIDTMVLEFF